MAVGKIIPKGAGAFAQDIAAVTLTGAVPQLTTGVGKILVAGAMTYVMPKHLAKTSDGKLITKAVGYLMIADGIAEAIFGPPGVVA